MKDKKSFLLYCDLIHTIEKMPSEKAGDLFKHILRYVNDQNPETTDMIIELTFEPIKQQLKRDLVKWESFVQKQSDNGKLGGRPKTQIKPNKAVGFLDNPIEAKKAVTVTDTVIDKDIKGGVSKIQPKYNIKELAAEYLVNFNRLFDKSFKSTATIEPLLEHWLKQYTPLEIGEALRKAKSNPGDWTSKMITESPEKILRTKNKNGPCDYIATVLNAAPKKDESVYVYPPLMAGN